MPLLPGSARHVVEENIRELRNSGRPEAQAVAIAMSHARRTAQSTQQSTHRSLHDIARDLQTIRSGKMPDGSAAPRPKMSVSAPDADPIEDQRMRLAVKRNKGLLKDVNLPIVR